MAATEFEIPEHLKELDLLINQAYNYEPGESDYSKIAFSLLDLAVEGTNEKSLKAVSNFIQMQHQDQKNRFDKLETLKNEMSRYLEWRIREAQNNFNIANHRQEKNKSS